MLIIPFAYILGMHSLFIFTLLKTLLLLVAAPFRCRDWIFQFQRDLKVLATKRQGVLTSHILYYFYFTRTENIIIIITQEADEVCLHPSIWWFSCDNLWVVVLRFYLVSKREKSSYHVVICTRLVATKISIILPI